MEQQTITLKTYRYVFSSEITEQLSVFAKIHQYDDRKDFKEAWTKWIKEENIEPLINDEVKRIKNLGFEGDPMEKMFKSARYYYRNKTNQTKEESKQRKPYETISRDIQQKMDEHINHQIKASAENGISKISPAESFDDYLNQNKTNILEELRNTNAVITKSDCQNLINKYKKSYKNRFYNIRVALNGK